MAISWRFHGSFMAPVESFPFSDHGKAMEKPCGKAFSCCEDMNPDDALVDLRYCSEAKGMVFSLEPESTGGPGCGELFQ